MPSPSTETAKVDLPLPASANAKTAISVWTSQSSTLKQAAGYGTTPTVQAAVTATDQAVVDLQGTVTKIDNLEAELAALKKTRTVQLATVHIEHDNVKTAINTASKGDPQAAQAWTGKTKARTKPTPVTAEMTPPVGAGLAVVKRKSGSVRGHCTPEAGALGYVFQWGADPNHPESWPPGVFTRGHTYTQRNQSVGQLACLRVAIVRRGSVQSQWTQVLQVVVR